MQSNVDAVSVRVGLLVGSFQAVDGQIVGFEFKLGEVPAKSMQLDTAPGGVFQGGNRFAPNQICEPRASHIPRQGNTSHQHHHTDCGLNPQASVQTAKLGCLSVIFS